VSQNDNSYCHGAGTTKVAEKNHGNDRQDLF